MLDTVILNRDGRRGDEDDASSCVAQGRHPSLTLPVEGRELNQ